MLAGRPEIKITLESLESIRPFDAGWSDLYWVSRWNAAYILRFGFAIQARQTRKPVRGALLCVRCLLWEYDAGLEQNEVRQIRRVTRKNLACSCTDQFAKQHHPGDHPRWNSGAYPKCTRFPHTFSSNHTPSQTGRTRL